jgi:CBS domain-containing protein
MTTVRWPEISLLHLAIRAALVLLTHNGARWWRPIHEQARQNREFSCGVARAADIMSADPFTVVATAPLDEVAYAMSEKKIGSVIVNDEDGQFLGIFTASDALNALIEIIRGGGTPAA